MWFPREVESCPTCGRFGLTLQELFTLPRLPLTGGLPILAVILAVIAPSPWEAILLGTGFAPLLVALAWLGWRRSRRDATCFVVRIREIETRLSELGADLSQTDARLRVAREERDVEERVHAIAMLEREIAQDRRLRTAQRRMLAQLRARLERLEIDRFRAELSFHEACRDARLESTDLAEALGERIDAVEEDHADDGEAWGQVVEEARLLQRQLARGVQRLHAARRLDPLTHAEAAGEVEELPALEESELEVETDLQLERIERSLAAVDELAAELTGDPDASGVRLRVDDEMLAALEDELESEPERGERSSFV